MKYYGTKNNKDYGFYLKNFNNAIEISDEYWKELLSQQSEGKIIIPFENQVIAINENEYSFENGNWRKLTPVEAEIKKQEKNNNIRKQEILFELEELDKKRIRAIAEPSLMDNETSWLEYYNRQIKNLRNELEQLNI